MSTDSCPPMARILSTCQGPVLASWPQSHIPPHIQAMPPWKAQPLHLTSKLIFLPPFIFPISKLFSAKVTETLVKLTLSMLVIQSCLTLCDHMDCGPHQALLSMGFSRQEYWSGLPFPSPGDLPNPGIEPGSPALQADSLPSESPGESS